MQATLSVAIHGKGLADLMFQGCTKMVLKMGATLLLLCGAGGSEKVDVSVASDRFGLPIVWKGHGMLKRR